MVPRRIYIVRGIGTKIALTVKRTKPTKFKVYVRNGGQERPTLLEAAMVAYVLRECSLFYVARKSLT